MSNHNYSQYSNNKKKKNYNKPKFDETIEEVATFEDEGATTVDATVEDVVETTVEPAEIKMAVETVETVSVPATVTGTVINCTKLNVRSKPAIDSDILAVLNSDTEIEIDPARSTAEWLKITIGGVDGFCMRKFVKL